MSIPPGLPTDWQKSMERSRSLPRVAANRRISKRGSLQGENREMKVSAAANATRSPSWSSWLLLTPPTGLLKRRQSERSGVAPTPRKPMLSRAPVLTLLLIRLEEALPGYFESIAAGNMAAASVLLDTTEATAFSPASSPYGTSPASTPSPGVSPTASPNRVSPLRRKNSPSILALEAEWERYVSPLLLLAGAEAMFVQMDHILGSGAMSKRLQALYQRIGEDLTTVKSDLCNPFLATKGAAKTEQAATSTQSTAAVSAQSLSTAIEALLHFVTVREELIHLHADMFLGKENYLTAWKQRSHELWKGLPLRTKEQCGSALVLLESIDHELKAHTAAITAVHQLKCCSFMDTVINSRILKVHMRNSQSSVLQLWLRTILETLLSVMPIFFDKIDAYAAPLYGFNKKRMIVGRDPSSKSAFPERIGVTQDYDSSIIDFLRRHESKGGYPMAVSVILDSGRTSNLYVERGYQSKEISQPPPERPHEQWPALYMRTTLHSGSSSRPIISRSPSGSQKTSISSMMNKLGRSQNIRKVASKRDTKIDSDHRSESTLLRSWSADTSSPRSKSRQGPNVNVLEYAPDLGKLSWPHIEWEKIVSLLTNEREEALPRDTENEHVGTVNGQAVTYQGVHSKEYGKSGNNSPLPITNDPLSGGHLPPASAHSSTKTSSVYHVARLNEFMWMVVLVKSEEEAKWHLRRSRGHSDEEIRSFLSTTASKLRIERNVFSLDSLRTVKRKCSKSSRIINTDDLSRYCTSDEWRDKDVDHFLGALKDIFGLQPQSPMRQPLKRSQVRSTPTIDHVDSAMAFFLGPELYMIFR